MTLAEVEAIQMALDELGLALVRNDSEYIWTLHQRRLYEKATAALNSERQRLNNEAS